MKKKVEKEEPLYKKIISYVVSILCLLLCLYITIEVITANKNNRPPRIFGVSISYVPTQSMEPTISAGDYIVFTYVKPEKLKCGTGSATENHNNKVGDIAIYYNEGEKKFIVHRIVEIGEDTEGTYYIFWGDNNPVQDSVKVRADKVYGRYSHTVAILSIFSGGINQNLIFFILVAIFVIMLVMQVASIFIKDKTSEIKKDAEEKKELLREELRRQILAEELAKLKALNEKQTTTEESEENEKTEE